jgi:hypothetical protein
MNKKRKVLTLVALAVFSVIIALHYTNLNGDARYWHDGKRYFTGYEPTIEDVRMPMFVLAVFYAALFAMLGDSKRKQQ